MSNPTPPETFGPDDFAAATLVSRETLDRLVAYVALLKDWNRKFNLVSEVSLEQVWHRHIYDSAQLEPLVPHDARTLADLGSGAGFPGLVLAILRPTVAVSLFEATRKKADFLRAVAGELKLKAEVRNQRIEEAPRQVFDVITARAFAPLADLLGYAQNFTGRDTVLLLLKGQKLDAELTEAQRFWRMKFRKHPSLTHPLGVILEIRTLANAST